MLEKHTIKGFTISKVEGPQHTNDYFNDYFNDTL